MKAKSLYKETRDGDTIKVNGRLHKIACCDCGLIHLLEFRLVKGSVITFKAYRDNRATAQRRRWLTTKKQ